MNTPTDEQVQWAAAVQRAAASGTYVLKGKPVTQADTRKAQRIMAAVQGAR